MSRQGMLEKTGETSIEEQFGVCVCVREGMPAEISLEQARRLFRAPKSLLSLSTMHSSDVSLGWQILHARLFHGCECLFLSCA